MSEQSPNRRPACGKTSIDQTTSWFGGCIQSNKDKEPVTIYQNVTKVPTHYTSSGEAHIDPYARWYYPAYTNCSPNFEEPCGDGLTNENPFCGIPLPVTEFNTVPQGLQISSGRFTNSYIDEGITSSFDPCRNTDLGEKRVFAKKHWHGMLPFTSRDHGFWDTMEYCGRCPEIKQTYAPETTHYLTITGNSSYSKVQTGYDTITGYANAGSSVDKYTGKVTATTQSGSGDGDNAPAVICANLLQSYICNTESGIAGINDLYDSIVTDYIWASDPEVITPNANGFVLEWFWSGSAYAQLAVNWGGSLFFETIADGQTEEIHLYYTPTTVEYYKQIYQTSEGYVYNEEWSCNANLTHTYTTAQVQSECAYLLSLIDLGDPKLNWNYGFSNNGPLVTYDETSEYPTLWLDNYTSPSSASGQIKGRLTEVHVDKYWNPEHENWALCTSDLCTSKYIESYGAYSTECGYPCATQWLTQKEISMIPYGCAFNQSGQMWTTPSSCAATETKVNDLDHWMCKQAVILMDKPSFNWGRPWGIDRLQIVEDSNRCINTIVGTTVTIEDYDPPGESSSLATGDYAWVNYPADEPGYGGIWQVTATGDFTIVLSTRIASSSWFDSTPFDVTDISSGNTGFIAKAKWYGMPGINGRVDITDVIQSGSTNVTCSLAEPMYVFKGDMVRIAGVNGINELNNQTWVVSDVIDAQHICLAGSTTLTASNYVANSGQMYYPFANDWKWNDTATKGDYVVHTWTSNYRDVGEYARLVAQYSASIINENCDAWQGLLPEASCSAPTYPDVNPRAILPTYGQLQTVAASTHTTHCLPFSPCGPKVAYFAPAPEPLLQAHFNCNYHGWQSVLIDGVYGSQWQGMIQDYDTDYGWQAPPCVCTERNLALDPDVDPPILVNTCNCTWTEDPGCNADQERVEESGIELQPCLKYYPTRPNVEARADLPDGAPAYFRNQVRYLNTTRLLVNDTNGRIMQPPVNGGHFYYTGYLFQYNQIPYFQAYQSKQVCCPDGRWAEIYAEEGIDCDEVPI